MIYTAISFFAFSLFYFLYIRVNGTKKLTQKIGLLLIMFALPLMFISCKKDSEVNNDTMTKNGIPLSGNQEVPAIASTATGSIDVSYTKSTKTLNYTVRWSNLANPPSAMHFHAGPRGVSTAVLVGVTGFPATATGSHSGTVTLNNTSEKEEDVLNGQWYFNIHNSTYPRGEIRGQIEF